MKKQVNKKRVKFFGIKVAKDDRIDYQDLIARMFMCPYFTPEHAIQYTQMLENGELSVERLVGMIEDETLSATINNDRSDEVMQEQLKEWEHLLGSMTDEDKAYLYENYGFKVTPRKNDKKTDGMYPGEQIAYHPHAPVYAGRGRFGMYDPHDYGRPDQ